MKILLVDLEYDYGRKERGINTIRHYGYQAAMESLGHKIETFFYDSYLNNLGPLQDDLLNCANSTQPDLIFFILFQNQFETTTLDKLKEKYKTINWFGDDTWRFDHFTKKYAPHFSHCITTDKFSLTKYKNLGIENVILSQWAAIESNLPQSTSNEYQYDVSFVGAHNSYRSWFIDQLTKHDISVKCFGHGWKNGSVSNEEMSTIFRQTKVNLNLSNSVHYDLRYLTSSFKSLVHSLRSSKSASQIKARNFEIPYSGGFQLTDYTPSLEDYFEIGTELACYNTLEDALTQIRYYLSNNERREAIKIKGQVRAQNNHCYRHRMDKVFKDLLP